MTRNRKGQKIKGVRPPRDLLALRKRARRKGKLINYHGTLIPDMPEGKRRRVVIQMARSWQLKKRKAVKADA